MPPLQELSLSEHQWYFSENSSTNKAESWRPCSTFPTVIQHELRELGEIPDESIEYNERKIQWVGERDWLFKTSFPTPDDVGKYSCADLVFDGLDTIATVRLNGKEILRCDNMFVPERVDVKALLNGVREENELEILFESAARVGREREKEAGKENAFVAIRETSRMYVRKAQFQWGWDWGAFSCPLML